MLGRDTKGGSGAKVVFEVSGGNGAYDGADAASSFGRGANVAGGAECSAGEGAEILPAGPMGKGGSAANGTIPPRPIRIRCATVVGRLSRA